MTAQITKKRAQIMEITKFQMEVFSCLISSKQNCAEIKTPDYKKVQFTQDLTQKLLNNTFDIQNQNQ